MVFNYCWQSQAGDTELRSDAQRDAGRPEQNKLGRPLQEPEFAVDCLPEQFVLPDTDKPFRMRCSPQNDPNPG